MADDAPPPDLAEASDAFQALGDETRLGVIRTLAAGAEDAPRSFSDLQEAVNADTSAGFAYHLRQLTDRYVEQTDEGYGLTSAGRAVVRALAAGTYTERVERAPIEIGDDCPLCGDPSLSARVTDNRLTVGCTACGQDLLTLPVSPAGHRTQDDLVSAFDRHQRHRIAAMADGTCPDCGGAVSRAATPADGDDTLGNVHADLSCRACGARLQVPVSLAVADHPAVVALYHEHGEDIRERPVWNPGEEWREAVVSEDPLAVRVSTVVGEERLSLFVGSDLSVIHTELGYVGEKERTEQAAA